jgi:cation transport ATPase
MDNLDHPTGDPAWRFRGFQTWPASIDAQRDFLTIAASLAAQSQHPCAKDLHRVALWNSQGTQAVSGFQDFGERGFGGAVQLPGESTPRAALIGTATFLTESGMSNPRNVINRRPKLGRRRRPGLLLRLGQHSQSRPPLRRINFRNAEGLSLTRG